ncbi:hypothetical protein QS257_09920 [Terrilactibacillus sp. S3-3]|nr:hypothetical protein QS257_09920 [Terrilactibacillus sp. S3-3]
MKEIAEKGKEKMDIHELTAAELLEHYQLRTLSPVEAVESLFLRIEKLNPGLNAFVTLNRQEAMRAVENSRAPLL